MKKPWLTILQSGRNAKRINRSALGGYVRCGARGGDQFGQKFNRHIDRQNIGNDNRRSAIGVHRVERRAFVGKEPDYLADLGLRR